MLRNEKGVALVTVMMLSLVSLIIIATLLYMVTSWTQISGKTKHYSTALEAAKGGLNVVKNFIDTQFTQTTIPLTFTNISTLRKKLTKGTNNWDTFVDKTIYIDPVDPSTYDFFFDLEKFRVYGKVIDTVEGNSDISGITSELGTGSGVTESSTQAQIQHFSYFYTIGILSQRPTNSDERVNMEMLYQY